MDITFPFQKGCALTAPAAGVYSYRYDGQNNLASVSYPDATLADPDDDPTRVYHYEDTRFPHHLTGITDENGGRFSTCGYDAAGRGCYRNMPAVPSASPSPTILTAATLVCKRGIGRYLGRPFWQYYPASNPGYNSPWLTRGWGFNPPFAPGAAAQSPLQLPPWNPGTATRPVVPRWYEPVRGPRPAVDNPQWGAGGGPEYIRGWTWPITDFGSNAPNKERNTV